MTVYDWMDLDHLVSKLPPPPKLSGRYEGQVKHHLPEGAVMVACAIHPLQTKSTGMVLVHLDGKHGKRFDFAGHAR